MRPLFSEILLVMVTDLLPKISFKNTTQIRFPMQKIFAHSIHLSIFVHFPWLNEFLSKKNKTGKNWKYLKYLNILIGFLVNLSPLTLFDIKLKLIGAITCI